MLAVSLVTVGDPGQLTGGYLYHRRMADAAPAHGARVDFVSFPSLPFPAPSLFGADVVRRSSNADVVLLDSIAAAFLAPWLGLLRRPLVAVLHQPPGGIDHGPPRAQVQAALDRLAYRRAIRLVLAAAQLADAFGDDDRVVVIPPGRDVAVSAAPGVHRRDLRAGRKAALLCVGNWVERKGIVDLLDAVGHLPDDAATLHLVGRTDVDLAYSALVRARLTDRVVVHGPVSREEVAAFYAAADVFVLPSRREPYGTVYGEAMAAGLPVVGWRAGNLPHLADDGAEGVVLAPGDVAGLTAALARLCDDEDWRRSLAMAARRRAMTRPTWADSAARLFGVLREAAGSAR